MEFSKVFFTNISLLITFGYMFNLVYKYMLLHTGPRLKTGFTVLLIIFAGWFSMLFGLQLSDMVLFDLRFVPIIFAILLFTRPELVALVGIGIGMARLTFGLSTAAWVGLVNMTLLGIAGAALVMLFNNRYWTYRKKAIIAIFTLNTLNIMIISAIGVIPTVLYLTEIAVITYPLGLLLSALFIFIIRDFYKEQKRVEELRNINIILRRQTRELREAKRQLEEKAHQLTMASQYKSEFLANMSHELKTPLNSIILVSQMLKEAIEEHAEREACEDEARYAGIIHAAGNDLLDLINDILDLSKVEAGKMDLFPEQVLVQDVLHALRDQFKPLSDKKGLEFEVHIAADVPAVINTDARRVSQVLRNLLSNAFKFTDSGTIRLAVAVEHTAQAGEQSSVHATALTYREKRKGWRKSRAGTVKSVSTDPGTSIRTGASTGVVSSTSTTSTTSTASTASTASTTSNKQQLVFTVADTGIGIEPDKQQLIFEAFSQADGAINRKYGGTGLGLSICLQLSRLLGGELLLQSSPGEGSVFCFRLPLTDEIKRSL